jgi:hypothetical protein
MPRTTRTIDKSKQVNVRTAAKRARIEEAGMGGPRIGRETSTTQAAQARRDANAERARRAAAVRKAVPLKATPAPKASSKSKTNPTTKPKVKAKSRKKVAYAKPRVKRKSPIIEVRASSSVQGSAKLDHYVQDVVSRALAHFAARLTRIGVHLTDENADKEGLNDKRCQIEARPASRKPLSTSATADSVEKALALAVGKMKRKLASRLGTRPSARGRV